MPDIIRVEIGDNIGEDTTEDIEGTIIDRHIV